MPVQEVSEKEFNAAKGDPTKMPTLGGEDPDSEETAAPAGNITDIRPEWTLAGYTARPISAGVTAILEEIDHSLYTTGLEKMTQVDILILLYVLFWPNAAELVEHSLDGTMKKEAMKWALELTPGELATAEEQAQGWLNEAGVAMQALGVDEDDPPAKKNIGSPPG